MLKFWFSDKKASLKEMGYALARLPAIAVRLTRSGSTPAAVQCPRVCPRVYRAPGAVPWRCQTLPMRPSEWDDFGGLSQRETFFQHLFKNLRRKGAGGLFAIGG